MRAQGGRSYIVEPTCRSGCFQIPIFDNEIPAPAQELLATAISHSACVGRGSACPSLATRISFCLVVSVVLPVSIIETHLRGCGSRQSSIRYQRLAWQKKAINRMRLVRPVALFRSLNVIVTPVLPLIFPGLPNDDPPGTTQFSFDHKHYP